MRMSSRQEDRGELGKLGELGQLETDRKEEEARETGALKWPPVSLQACLCVYEPAGVIS